jgi:O-antigen/teichoic acid export membrane protein
VRSLLGYGSAKVFPGLLNFAVIPILIHTIGAGQYALLSSAWSLSLIASVLGVGWLRNAGLRSAGDPAQAMGLLPRWSLIAAVLLPAALSTVTLAALGGTLPAFRAPAMMGAAALFSVCDAGYTLFATRAQCHLRSGRFAVAETVRAAVSLAAALVLGRLLPVPGAVAALAGFTVGTVCGAVAMSGPGRVRFGRRPAATDTGVLRSYWHYGWPLSFWFAASTGLVYIDRLLLTLLLGPEPAGRYASVADLVVRGTAVVALPIGMAAHPMIMICWNAGQRRRAVETLAAYARILALILAGGVAVLAWCGPWLLARVVPLDGPSRTLIVLLGLGAALWQGGLLAQKLLEMSGHSRLMTALMLLAVLITAGSALLLIPVAGVVGAALSLLLGAAIYTASCLFAGFRVFKP